jgi:hypothetical protein
MIAARPLVPILMVLALGSVAAVADDFVAYEGKDAVQEGRGGEKKTVDGIDFWSNGAPPQKFQLLGYINDTRMKSGLLGKMRMSGLESSIAKEAKKAGGDAVILMGTETETKGYVGLSNTNSQATSTTYGNTNGTISGTTNGNTTTGQFQGNTNSTTTTQAHSFSTGASAAVQNQHTRYAVVKYLAN